ncbi:protein NinD [Mixta calida]|uniref:protein NinD n=1 Tax=Mixta calida TaxID=665913 RepID=UPI00403A8E30
MDSQRLYRCDRCQIPKPADRFREDLSWWHKWCIRCEASPVGEFPIPETDKHRRRDGDTEGRPTPP